jgi:hypothetical protein
LKTLKETDLKLTHLSGNIEIDAADSEEMDGASSKSEN